MKTLKSIRAIKSPTKRVHAAAALDTAAEQAADQARALRENAVVSANLDFNVPPVRLYRELGISRALWSRMKQRANARSPLPELRRVTGLPLDDGDAMIALAKKAADDVRHWERTGKVAREIRDDTGRGLMNGDYEETMTNADFARLIDRTSARAAQLRKEPGKSTKVLVK